MTEAVPLPADVAPGAVGPLAALVRTTTDEILDIATQHVGHLDAPSALDGWSRLTVTAEGRTVATAAEPGSAADCTIEGTERDLLALLLGRPVDRPITTTAGDTALAAAFKRAFPGP